MNRNARVLSGVLDRIVGAKRAEVEALRSHARTLRQRAGERGPRPSLAVALAAGPGLGVIAEVKRRSPSAGEIRTDAAAVPVARGYAEHGAAAVSVLTDGPHFGGTLADLEAVTAALEVPVLRKDFTIDALQVWEAAAAGASAVLLITRILDDAALADLAALARELGMDALVEVHDEEEVDRALRADARIIGVNNRDLDTFVTDLAVTERLAPRVPADRLLVSESAIHDRRDAERVAAAGASAVLVGGALMRAPDPGALLRELGTVPRGVR